MATLVMLDGDEVPVDLRNLVMAYRTTLRQFELLTRVEVGVVVLAGLVIDIPPARLGFAGGDPPQILVVGPFDQIVNPIYQCRRLSFLEPTPVPQSSECPIPTGCLHHTQGEECSSCRKDSTWKRRSASAS